MAKHTMAQHAPTPHPANDAAADEDVSLQRLTDAFAEVLGKDGPQVEGKSRSSSESDAAEPETLEAADADASQDAGEISPSSVLEAMLFVGHPQNEALTAEQASSLMRGVEPAEIHELVRELNDKYLAQGRPIQIFGEGAGYHLRLREEFHRLRDKFYGRVRAAKLSQAAIEILALVAYGQPMTREEVDRLRDVSSGAILRQLVRRRLLRIERTDARPRKTHYYTTARLLQLLGLDSLQDLPESLDLDKH